MKTNAVRVHEFGGPEVMKYEEVELPSPGTGEATIRHTAIGLNYIDVYHRTGLYPLKLPAGLGSEAAGIIEAVGDGVSNVSVGDRVVYTGRPADAYSEARNYSASGLVRIPDNVSDEQAAAFFLKGMTAWFLLHRSYAVKQGDSVLVHAAAGGVGSILVQWARHLGATVIGVVSNDEKASRASSLGCNHVLLAGDDIPGSVRRLTGDIGVAAVYDSVGRDTFFGSLDSLQPHGTMVTFGNASGPVDPFSPAELAKRHSLYLTRPVLFDFIDTPQRLQHASGALFDAIAAGHVVVEVEQRYKLTDVASAHRDLENRKTVGSTVLIP